MKVLVFFIRIIAVGFGLLCLGVSILAGIGTYQDQTLGSGEIIILAIILLLGLVALKIGLPPYTSKEERERELQRKKEEEEARRRIERSLNHLINISVNKGYTFIDSDVSQNSIQEQLARFDDRRSGTYNKIFGFMISGYDMPEFAKTISKNVIGFGTEKIDDEELAALQQLMASTFPLCAIGFNQMYGARFLAILNGDTMQKNEFFDALDAFQQINLLMMVLGGRISIKLFGRSLLAVDSSAATGSIIFVSSNTERAQLVRQWLSEKPLHNDTMLNQMKERFTSVKFWAKAVFGFIEVKPHQLRQEAIVLDAQSQQSTSTVSPRLGFEFGFSLDEITNISSELS
ncbi:MAG: hypothetical protein QNJ46_35650 [Leptolyngbyaceae cyanobacterium MO_188.B28]|nr:hypothetical protein [Leptolyngbyaceae cyanobacterium MO_188.B28]